MLEAKVELEVTTLDGGEVELENELAKGKKLAGFDEDEAVYVSVVAILIVLVLHLVSTSIIVLVAVLREDVDDTIIDGVRLADAVAGVCIVKPMISKPSGDASAGVVRGGAMVVISEPGLEVVVDGELNADVGQEHKYRDWVNDPDREEQRAERLNDMNGG